MLVALKKKHINCVAHVTSVVQMDFIIVLQYVCLCVGMPFRFDYMIVM